MADTLAPEVSAEELAAMAELDAAIDGGRPAEREPEAEPAAPAKVEPEAERDYEAEAKADGWTTLEEWVAAGKDPEKHRDAKTFVELSDNDPAVLRRKYDAKVKEVEDFKSRISAATKAEIERTRKAEAERYRNEITALERERDQLIEQYAGDAASIREINNRFEQAKGNITDPDAIVAATEARAVWVSKYPQYETSLAFQGAANLMMERIIAEETEADIVRAGSYAAVQANRFALLEKRLAEEGLISPPSQPKPSNGAPPPNSRSIDGARTIQTRDTRGFDSLPAEAKAMYRTLEADGIKIKKEDFAKDFYNG